MKYRIATLFLFVFVGAILCAIPIWYRQIQLSQLRKFQDHDLTELESGQQQEFASLIDSILQRDRGENFFDWYEPLAVWVDRNDRTHYLEHKPVLIHPGGSMARLHSISRSGRPISTTQFPTGWRTCLKSAHRITNGNDETLLFIIRSVPYHGGRDIATQYYALANDQLHCLLIRDSNGLTLSNRLAPENLRVGPISDLKLDDHAANTYIAKIDAFVNSAR